MNKNGFSLVEIMIALVVLIFGLYGVLDLFYNSDTARTNGQLKQQAALLMIEKMETIKASGFENINAYIDNKLMNAPNQPVYYPNTFALSQQNPRLKWRAELKKSSDNPEIIDIFITVLWNIKQSGEVEVPKAMKITFAGNIVK